MDAIVAGDAMNSPAKPQTRERLIVRTLVLCGLISSVFYITIDVIGALSYPGYDFLGQAISEMSAVGAPTVDLLAPLYRIWSFLFVAFSVGVWIVGRDRPPLRWAALFMVAVTIVGSGLSFFPMNPRSEEPTLNDTMHLLFACATMLLLSAVILSGGRSFGRRFRLYSVATVAIMLLFFVLTMTDVPNIAHDRPTRFMGLNERISMTAWLGWIGALSVRLLGRRKIEAQISMR